MYANVGRFHITLGNIVGAFGVVAGFVTAHAGLLPADYSNAILTVAGVILSISNSLVKHSPPAVSTSDADKGKI
jgi:hypothetical protein